jgi:hypothetical protein
MVMGLDRCAQGLSLLIRHLRRLYADFGRRNPRRRRLLALYTGCNPCRRSTLGGGRGQLQADGFATRAATGFGISPETTCASVTPSRIARSEARRAIHTSWRAVAEPT